MNKTSLLGEGCTCVIYNDKTIVFSSKDTGIKPLLYIIESGIDVRGCRAADKIVGRAAAMLYSYMEVTSVYAQVMSEGALAFLTENSIQAQYDTLTKQIINRKGDDICPMEKAVENVVSPYAALACLKNKIKELG